MKHTIDDPQGYIEKLRPLFGELFRTAHAIVGNLELAEYVLKKAVYEAYLRRNEWRERMSFREGLGQTVRMVAMSELTNIRGVGSFEGDWTPPDPRPDIPPEQRALFAKLMRESDELNRTLMLYYACGLRVSQIAMVMNQKPAKVRDTLYMLRTRLERTRRGSASKHSVEDDLERLLRGMLQSPGDDIPASGQILRAFERDADAAPKPRRSVGRIVAIVLCTIGALLCAALFWLVAVLMEPSTPQPSATPNQQIEQMQHDPEFTKTQQDANAIGFDSFSCERYTCT